MLNQSLRNKISMFLHFLCRVCTASCFTGQDVTPPLSSYNTVLSLDQLCLIMCLPISHTALNSLYLTKWSSIDFNPLTFVFKVLMSCLWSDVRLSESGTVGPSQGLTGMFCSEGFNSGFLCSSIFTVYIPHDYSEYHDLPLMNIHDTF